MSVIKFTCCVTFFFFLSIWLEKLNDHLSGKELFIRISKEKEIHIIVYECTSFSLFFSFLFLRATI